MNCKESKPIIVGISLTFLILVAAMAFVPVVSADDSKLAQSDDIRVSPSVDFISINAGETSVIYLDVHNLLVQEQSDPNTLAVYFSFKNTDEITVTFPQGSRVQIDGGETSYCEVKIAVSKYAKTTEHVMSFDITINDPDRGSPIKAFDSDLINISIYSSLSSGENYNKILGVWDNPFPEPFNSPLVTTIISLMVWISAAIIIAYFIVPVLYVYYESAKHKIIKKRGHDDG